MHVPGWHEATREWQRGGELQQVGIIQEQHPDRARLFMQWKDMGWPILIDSLDLLETTVVPMTLLIDEYGVIRQIQPPRDDLQGLRERAVHVAEGFVFHRATLSGCMMQIYGFLMQLMRQAVRLGRFGVVEVCGRWRQFAKLPAGRQIGFEIDVAALADFHNCITHAGNAL